LLVKLAGQNLLHGAVVFLSASKPNRWLDQYHLLAEEVDEAVLSLCRAVFSESGRLVYGGHPSISPLIATVASEYFSPDLNNGNPPVLIYQSKAYEKVIPDTTRLLEQLGYARIRWVERYDDEEFRNERHCPNSLRLMREAMLSETKPVAMVSVGGMEGIVNEGSLFLRMGLGDVYVLRTTAGATAELRERLLAQNPKWDEHLIVLEDAFPYEPLTGEVEDLDRVYQAPLAPYPLLMQHMVRHISARLRNR
jgi:hypothetical protein